MKREFAILLGGWLVLAVFLSGLGRENLSAPGLYYDEAVFAGLTRDFLDGRVPGNHMPGAATTEIFGAPFPVFVQPYLGALKCWLLLPAFKLFGSGMAVLRASNLFFATAALFLFMLWTWRLLGLWAAMLAGFLLATDPAFFFASMLDWGSLLPSLLCRFAGFILVLLAWRRQQARWALLAGLAFGLGFFNKIDFAVLLAGAAAAAICAYGRAVKTFAGGRRPLILVAGLGFTIGGGLMLLRLPFIFSAVLSGGAPGSHGELAEKLFVHRAMYDGSYFYRLMDAGGMFDKMRLLPPPVWTPFGIVFLAAILILTGSVLFSAKGIPVRQTRIFLLLSAVFVTLGVLILPGAVRIHHTMLVYPFPQLIIAAATAALWNRPWISLLRRWTARGLAAATLALLAGCQIAAIARTQQLIRETGGRGWWSNALIAFSGEVRQQPGLTLVSLDWGFNEQLEFLTANQHLNEACWPAISGEPPKLLLDSNHLYLAHPPEFSLYPLGVQFMEAAAHDSNAVIHPWPDAQGRIAFYTIRFGKP